MIKNKSNPMYNLGRNSLFIETFIERSLKIFRRFLLSNIYKILYSNKNKRNGSLALLKAFHIILELIKLKKNICDIYMYIYY